jgi:hypothetical protein
MGQIHKRFTDAAVKEILDKYTAGQIAMNHALSILGVKRSRFFTILQEYKQDPVAFSVSYVRQKKTRGIDQEIENKILSELRHEKALIADKDMPITTYNYSYIKDQLFKNYGVTVSVPTIIDRAKKHGCYIPKHDRSKRHDREVLTNYIGELVQHDASFHKWSPCADKKWYLITSIDDFSRLFLYADLVEAESSWAHIIALQSVMLSFGVPAAYYVDSHSIFRFVQGRDSIWREHRLFTDDATPQWKQVLLDCNVKVIHALSPQAKGKIERPYRWLQDRLVRTCAREHIDKVDGAREVLHQEVSRYNNHQVHSTTLEIPYRRFETAAEQHKSLFRQFTVKPPYQSHRDIFCLRAERHVNNYGRISLNNIVLAVPGVPIREKVSLRLVPNQKTGFTEVRMWYQDRLVSTQLVKNIDMNLVHF